MPRLTLKWAFGFEGDISAFGQPTIVGGQVFVGSAGGVVHALRADTGCLQWVFQATGPIRSAIVTAPLGDRHVLLFGDLTGWFYALDAATGQQIWKKRPEEHEAVRLSAPPVVHDGLVLIPVASWEESRALNAEYRLLHVPRQPDGTAPARWQRGVEDLHDSESVAAHWQDIGWRRHARTVRRRHLGLADWSI